MPLPLQATTLRVIIQIQVEYSDHGFDIALQDECNFVLTKINNAKDTVQLVCTSDITIISHDYWKKLDKPQQHSTDQHFVPHCRYLWMLSFTSGWYNMSSRHTLISTEPRTAA